MNKNHFLASALCGGALALAFFASCTDKDLYDPVQAQAIREAKYEAEFKKAFGDIDPNQDWGFGTATSTRATRAVEDMPSLPTAPKAPVEADFADAVPQGVGLYPNGYLASNGSYYVDGTINDINFQAQDNKCGTLYIVGNVTPSSNFYIGTAWVVDHNEGATIKLCKGATLNLTSEQATNLQSNVKIYMAEGSKICLTDNTSTSKIVLNSTEIYSKGTIEAYNIELNGNGLLYNCASGSVKITGDVSAKNANSRIVNEGTITCASFGTAGSSALWNSGYMTVNGATTIDSNCATFVNDGKYTTESLTYTAGSTNVYNACWLTVKETLHMTLGDTDKNCFYIGANGAVVAKRVEIEGPGYIKMGNNALLKATQEISLGCTKDEYGIHGIGTKYAVACAPKITKMHENQGFEVSYSGKLYVATDSHFEQGYSGQYPYIDWMDDDAKLCSGMYTAPITIAASECSPGYEGGKVSVTHRYRVYAEDLGAEVSDWDFNDVVFDVVQYSDNSTDIILQAAGGTLLSELVFTGDYGQVSLDIHSEFGVETTTMVNTRVNTVSCPAVTKHYNTLIEPRDVEIYITYSGGECYPIRSEKGQAAGKFCIDFTNIAPVDWMDEYVDIRTVYPNFGEWVSNATTIWWSQTPAGTPGQCGSDTPDVNGEYQTIGWQTTELYGNKYITFDNPKKAGTFIVTGQQEDANGTVPVMLTWTEYGLDWGSQCTGAKELSDSFFMTVTYDYKNNITSDKIAFANMPSCTDLTIKFKPSN